MTLSLCPRTSAPGIRTFLTTCATALVALAMATPAFAQAGTGTVVGRITDNKTSAGVPSATVSIDGTSLSAISDDEGRYRIVQVPAGTRTVVVRRIGYASIRQNTTVTAGSEATVDFALEPSVVALDQVVVTGVAGGEERRAVGNAVTSISAPDVLALSAAPDLGSLLNARGAGMVISQPTGRLGAGPAIQIRGRSSIGLGNSPLIYIDGVRVNNATGSGPSGVTGALGGQNSQVAGRLNDIIPEDIESIQIIKGPAASTLYGTEASNGVIQIITKRGSAGARPQFTVQAQAGTIFFRDAEGRMPTNYALNQGEIETWNAVAAEKERGTPLFETGQSGLYSATLSGARNDVRYYLSSAYEKSLGIEPNNSLRQFTLHGNVDVTAGSNFDVATSLNYVNNRSHLGVDNGASAMFGGVFGHGVPFAASRGFALGFTPEITQELWDNSQFVNRFTASTRIEHTPGTKFRQRLIIGLDYTGDDSRALERFAPPPLNATLSPGTAGGRIGQNLRNATNYTGDYSATGTVAISPSITSSTSIGGQFFRTESSNSSLGGIGFPGVGIETVSGAAQQVSASQSQQLNTTIGGFFQQKFAWRDRVFVTGAMRVDNNSAFGEDFQWITYPKFDASWVVSDEEFWGFDNVMNSFRLRAAYGESGRQPQTFSALRTFSPVQGPGGSNAVTPGSIGNADLRPERAKELELGFEAAFFDRLSLDFTYYTKRTEDLIINQAVAPSSGFGGSRPMNLGRVDNKGYELMATLQAFRNDMFDWQLQGSIATNRDEIKDLGGVPSVVASYGQYNVVGHPIGSFFSKRIVSAERDPATQRATNVLCEGPAGQAPVACASAPLVYIGTPTPRTTGAVSSTLGVGSRLRFFASVDFKRGFRVLNGTNMLRCTGALGLGLCEANYRPERYDPLYLAAIVGNAVATSIVDQHIEDASFAKLREVSATYDIPARWLPGVSNASFTVAARELHTWTSYSGIDPEVSSAGSGGTTALDQALLPPLSRFIATLNIRF